MMEITAEIRALIDKAAAGIELAGDEYIDPADGLIHCKKCGGQRQTVVPCFGKPGYFVPRCICQCQREAEEQRKAAEERQRRMERIKRRKAQGLQDCALPGFVDSKNEEKTERNAGYLVVSHSGGGMLRQGTRKGIRRTPANRGMRAHWIVKSLDISEDVCHGLCP